LPLLLLHLDLLLSNAPSALVLACYVVLQPWRLADLALDPSVALVILAHHALVALPPACVAHLLVLVLGAANPLIALVLLTIEAVVGVEVLAAVARMRLLLLTLLLERVSVSAVLQAVLAALLVRSARLLVLALRNRLLATRLLTCAALLFDLSFCHLNNYNLHQIVLRSRSFECLIIPEFVQSYQNSYNHTRIRTNVDCYHTKFRTIIPDFVQSYQISYNHTRIRTNVKCYHTKFCTIIPNFVQSYQISYNHTRFRTIGVPWIGSCTDYGLHSST
jgi:hypothetical protein